MKLTSTKPNKNQCCPCQGSAPTYRCSCHCHRQEDCEFWETVAFVWICDAKDEQTREMLWRRFTTAYPQHAHEDCGHFWDRVRKTRWHEKNRHRFHHHDHDHDYC